MTVAAPWPEAKAETRTEAAADDARMRKRQKIREQAAEASLLREKAKAIGDEIARLNRAVEDAADNHAAVCQPLQSELRQLEEKAVARIANREPSNEPTEDARRIELVRAIEQENARLEQVTREIEPEVKRLTAAQRRLEIAAAELPDTSALAHPDVARPEWKVRLYGLQQVRESLRRYLDSLADKIEQGEYYDSLPGPESNRGARWRAAAAATREQLDDIDKKASALYQEIINE